MEGLSRAAKHQFELAVTNAWHGETFARTKRLKKLSTYLKPKGSETPADMLGAFKAFRHAGLPINIRKLN